MATNFCETIFFMNFGNAVCIMRILVLKMLILYRFSPVTELAIRIIQGSVSVEELPTVTTWESLIPTCSYIIHM